jgi:cytochrome c oxidase subunit 4
MRTVNDSVSTSAPAPLTAYYLVYLALLVLLVATVLCANLHLGHLNIVVAMIIAGVKAGLVLWYFMHLRSSPKIVMMFMGMAVATLVIGGILSMSDYLAR